MQRYLVKNKKYKVWAQWHENTQITMGCIWSDRILQIGAAFYWGMKLATNLPDLAQLLHTAFYTTFFLFLPNTLLLGTVLSSFKSLIWISRPPNSNPYEVYRTATHRQTQRILISYQNKNIRVKVTNTTVVCKKNNWS